VWPTLNCFLSTRNCDANMRFNLHTCAGKSISLESCITGTGIAALSVSTSGIIATSVRFKCTLVEIYIVTNFFKKINFTDNMRQPLLKTDTVYGVIRKKPFSLSVQCISSVGQIIKSLCLSVIQWVDLLHKGAGWLVGCLTSHSTHYRSVWGRLKQLTAEIRLESHQNQSIIQ